MLKLNASYSKKVPAEGEFSSQSYHASIEVELPDGLSQEQLNDRIHATFALVRDSVEAELHGTAPTAVNEPAEEELLMQEPQTSGAHARPRDNGYTRHRSGGQEAASPKQISYLLSLASRRGITPAQIAAQNNVPDIQQLSKRQCSALIEQWKAA